MGITPNDGCFVGETFNGGSGNDSEDALNADMIFGAVGWEFIAKDNNIDGIDEGDSSAFSVTGDRFAGTIDIDPALWSAWSRLVLVLKSGSGNTGGWIGYEIEEDDGPTYAYTSVFEVASNGPNCCNLRALSHITLYGNGDGGDGGTGGEGGGGTSPVPLPAGVWLLLTAVGGLGLTRFRTKRA